MRTTIFKLSPVLASVLLFVSALPLNAGDTADASGSCEAFRLDWVTGGPFNPEPAATSSHDYAVCSGVENRPACLARHKGDGKQHPYVITHDQGSNGNCTFQAIAGVLNFDKSASGGTPDVSPEYLAAQDCDNLRPNHGIHNIARAIKSYNKSGSCTRADLANVSDGGELSETLESAYLSAAVASSISTLVDATKIARDSICRQLSSHSSSPETLSLADDFGEIADKLSQDKNILNKWKRKMDIGDEISHDVSAPPGTSADDKKAAKDRAIQRSAEYGHCKADQEFFNYLCKDKVQKPGSPHLNDKERQPADSFTTPEKYKELAQACSSTFSKPAPEKVPESFLIGQMTSNAKAKDCIMAYMRSSLMASSVDDIEKTGKPVVVEVSDATNLMGKSAKRSDVGHAMVLIGREKRGGKCGYWVRNSWGSSCPEQADPNKVKCDPDRPGNLWISADSMNSTAGVSKIYDVNP